MATLDFSVIKNCITLFEVLQSGVIKIGPSFFMETGDELVNGKRIFYNLEDTCMCKIANKNTRLLCLILC